MTFTSDPLGGDGIIYDNAMERAWPTEHILVPRARAGEIQDVEARLLSAIEMKQSKGGAAYASGKTLIVFLNIGGGQWFPNRVAKRPPATLNFDDVWVVSLQGVEASEYVYGVTQLHDDGGDAAIWRVRIRKDFDAWEIERIQ